MNTFLKIIAYFCIGTTPIQILIVLWGIQVRQRRFSTTGSLPGCHPANLDHLGLLPKTVMGDHQQSATESRTPTNCRRKSQDSIATQAIPGVAVGTDGYGVEVRAALALLAQSPPKDEKRRHGQRGWSHLEARMHGEYSYRHARVERGLHSVNYTTGSALINPAQWQTSAFRGKVY